LADLVGIARLFSTASPGTPSQGEAVTVTPYGAGRINDTFVVTPAGAPRFILQRINQRVFTKPRLIMVNLRTMTEHLARHPDVAPDGRRWEHPTIVPAQDGRDYVLDAEGGFWRALGFIEGARTYPAVADTDHAYEAGYALGRFQREISAMDVSLLHDTLPGFHITPRYLEHYDKVIGRDNLDLTRPDLRYAADLIEAHRDWVPVLQRAHAAGELRERPMHGDPKIDNIMIDDQTGKAVSVIDLDTVKPGLVQHDIGDCLRSSCNPLGEETTELDAVTFELDLCEAILRGYLPQVQPFYTSPDYIYLYDAVRILTFEQGLRFFSDHLEGNVYYKVAHPEENLNRALVQFRLLEHIEAQETQIKRLVASVRQ